MGWLREVAAAHSSRAVHACRVAAVAMRELAAVHRFGGRVCGEVVVMVGGGGSSGADRGLEQRPPQDTGALAGEVTARPLVIGGVDGDVEAGVAGGGGGGGEAGGGAPPSPERKQGEGGGTL